MKNVLCLVWAGGAEHSYDDAADANSCRDQFDRDYLEFEVNINDLEATLQASTVSRDPHHASAPHSPAQVPSTSPGDGMCGLWPVSSPLSYP
jgi:hypothetical protein